MFKEKLRKYASADDDYRSIELDKFETICYRILGFKLNVAQRELLFMTNGKVAPGNVKYLNVQQVYAARQMETMKRIYDKLKLGDNTEDDAQDAAGFTGDFHRKLKTKGPLKQLPEPVFFQLFACNKQKLNDFMRTIYSIDKDNNGYVTQTEIDDILKLIFAEKHMKNLKGTTGLTSLDLYDLTPFYKPFASSANRVLVDYKAFRDFLVNGIDKYKQKTEKTRNNGKDRHFLTSEVAGDKIEFTPRSMAAMN